MYGVVAFLRGTVMAKSKNGGLGDSVRQNGGMLLGFIFKADPDDVFPNADSHQELVEAFDKIDVEKHEKIEWEFDAMDVLFQDITFEEAEEYVEAHRGRMVSIEKQKMLESKFKHEGTAHIKWVWKAVYQWVPHSAGVRMATVAWKEYCDGDHGGGGMGMIVRMLGG